jgi:diaminohydroxyphosphoribosylaminopyrimidine deaminase/5-amino-6-(5-phosphoribosylamino)uracil reductase
LCYFKNSYTLVLIFESFGFDNKNGIMDRFKSFTNDEKYMYRCLELAIQGNGNVAPNPMVGSVIVHEGKIIGEGFHRKYGEAHAEVNAIESVKNTALLKESTLYVNLEPCSHYGKTPPCADLIIEKGIPNVGIGNIDCNSEVAGRGASKMKKAGIIVTEGVLKDSCRELNKRFYTFHEKNRPYIILKWAQTLDGFIDIKRKSKAEKPESINNQFFRNYVHKSRAEEQAIMIGTNTAILDNPKLTTREWFGKHPIRVVLDRTLRIDENFYLFDGSVKTLVFTEKTRQSKENLEYVSIDFDSMLLENIMNKLYSIKVLSIIVEGGEQLHNTFISQNLWDEAHVITGNKFLKTGINAAKVSGKIETEISMDSDKLVVYKND